MDRTRGYSVDYEKQIPVVGWEFICFSYGSPLVARMLAAARRLDFAQSTSGLAVIAAAAPEPANLGKVIDQRQAQLAPQGHREAQILPKSV